MRQRNESNNKQTKFQTSLKAELPKWTPEGKTLLGQMSIEAKLKYQKTSIPTMHATVPARNSRIQNEQHFEET